MSEITADDLGQLLSGKIGLVIGPGVTKYYGSYDDLTKGIAERAKIEAEASGGYLDTCDAVLDSGVSEDELCGWVREALHLQPQSTLLSQLAKVRWSAVLSGCLDSHFEEALQ